MFLTDHLDTTVFRHAGFTYEYFPPSVFGAEAQAPLFARRFETLWRKWAGAMLIDFSASGYLARRIDNLEEYINREMVGLDRFDPRLPKAPSRPKAGDGRWLRSGRSTCPPVSTRCPTHSCSTGCSCNDLPPPANEVGQTLANLAFHLLDHEPAARGLRETLDRQSHRRPPRRRPRSSRFWRNGGGRATCASRSIWRPMGASAGICTASRTKRFFLRGRYGQMSTYDQLRAQAHVRRFKNNYVINNNGARNAALRDGKGRAKWVLPWDGNCSLTAQAWSEIVTAVRRASLHEVFHRADGAGHRQPGAT